MLRSDAELDAWIKAARRFGVIVSQADRFDVFALAEAALRNGSRPAAYFVGSLQRPDWRSRITIDDEQAARRRIRRLDHAPASRRQRHGDEPVSLGDILKELN